MATEEIRIEMSWTRAVPLLLEIYTNAETPKGRHDARDELMRLAKIGDDYVSTQQELFDLRAYAEGWAVFEADGSEMNRNGDCPIQVQRLDEEGILESDEAAHKLVVEGAKNGKAHCLTVLKRLRREAKPELAVVYSSNGMPLGEFPACLEVTDEQLDDFEMQVFTRVVTRNCPTRQAEAA